ncbi:MAG: hypothetical protein JNK49_09945, partial [Planctomycetes bacterium]|nr:hypothetical protein [Planctomycetota bacterium]
MKIPLSIATTCVAAICSSMLTLAPTPAPIPTGTRPTRLINVAVVSTGTNTMRVQGQLVDMAGGGVAAVPIRLYEAGGAYFGRLGVVWTAGNGTFTY